MARRWRRRAAGPRRNGWSGKRRRSRLTASPPTPGPSTSWCAPDGSESIEGMVVTQGLLPRGRTAAGAGPHFRRVRNTWPGRAPVIILGYELWQRQVQRRSAHRRQDGPHQPPGHASDGDRRDAAGVRFLPSPTNAQEPNYNVNALVDFWIPATPNPARLKQPDWDVVGRLRDGATLAAGAGGTRRSRRQAGASRARFSRGSRRRCNP